ncbi:MAG: hypothetical protein WC860_08525, partial [Candidatus Margulisiibacteriota bacterium]
EYLEFNNAEPPLEAKIKLASNPGADNARLIALKAKSIPFPWAQKKVFLKKGDLIFSRGAGVISSTIGSISSWSHIAMVYDLKQNLTLEALPNGVDLYRPLEDWQPAITWAVKRVKSASSEEISKALDKINYKWTAKNGSYPMPYNPTIIKRVEVDGAKYLTLKTFKEWLIEWADKNKKTSMYCFKLVYHTFLGIGIDLDSNRSGFNQCNATLVDGFYESDILDNGKINIKAFIGITGDDIYYSKHLGTDIYSYCKENLDDPFLSD